MILSYLILILYRQCFFHWRNQVVWGEIKLLLCLPAWKLQMTYQACPLGTFEHIITPPENTLVLDIWQKNPPNMNPSVPRSWFGSTVTMPAEMQSVFHHPLIMSDTSEYNYQIRFPLTCPRRLCWWVGWENPLFFLPLNISSRSTPKLKTSDFTEKVPSIAYSGLI